MASKQPENTSKNKGGRPAGSPNKTTAEARAAFTAILQGKSKKISGWIDQVAKDDPAKACDLMLRIAEFYIPKPQRVEVLNAPGDDGDPGELIFRVKRE